MKIYRFDYKNTPTLNEEFALCLGYFDGVHIGHKTLIDEARLLNDKVGVLTFSSSFKKNDKQITTLEDKINIFNEMNIDYLFIVENNFELMNLDALDFITEVLIKINPKFIVCGDDFKFGHFAKGDGQLLGQYFNTTIKQLLPYKDKKISSSWIKELINEGDIEIANCLLNRPYKITSRIINGLGNGEKKLGFRTINVDLMDYTVPKFGVYYVELISNNVSYHGVANVGIHPSIDMLEKPIVEVYVPSEVDISTGGASVVFHTFVREEKQFENIEQLKEQIQKDLDGLDEFFL